MKRHWRVLYWAMIAGFAAAAIYLAIDARRFTDDETRDRYPMFWASARYLFGHGPALGLGFLGGDRWMADRSPFFVQLDLPSRVCVGARTVGETPVSRVWTSASLETGPFLVRISHGEVEREDVEIDIPGPAREPLIASGASSLSYDTSTLELRWDTLESSGARLIAGARALAAFHPTTAGPYR